MAIEDADSRAKHPGGVPPTLNGRVEFEVCKLVALGVPLMSAARLVGVNARTANYWYALGRSPDAPEHWREFRCSVDWARLEYAEAIAGCLRELRNGQLLAE